MIEGIIIELQTVRVLCRGGFVNAFEAYIQLCTGFCLKQVTSGDGGTGRGITRSFFFH